MLVTLSRLLETQVAVKAVWQVGKAEAEAGGMKESESNSPLTRWGSTAPAI